MATLELFRQHAAYNKWMNAQLYETCDQLTDADRHEDVGAFFASIHDTLKHLLSTDYYRLRQFDPENPFWDRDEWDDLVHWPTLKGVRVDADDEIVAWAGRLTEADLQQPIRTACWVDEKTHEYPLWHLLAHTFNHQTHHRGQVTAFLFQKGIEYGITGLAWEPSALEGSSVPL